MRAEATTLACSLPREKGKPFSRWSLSEIAACLIGLGLVSQIAVSTIGRWFRTEKLKPWRYHTWQHILDPQSFLERARPVLRLYAQAQALLRQGIWVVCADEKTSIQARQLEQAPRSAQPGKPVLVSPRYKRQGPYNSLPV